MTITTNNPTDHAYYVDMAYTGKQAKARRLNGIVTITPVDGEPIEFTREEFGPMALMFSREGDTTQVESGGDDLETGAM